MANQLKGEIAFAAVGASWTMVYDFNALCTIEQEMGVDPAELGDQLTSPTRIRTVFRIGLEAKHGSMTDLEAGRIIHDLGVQQAGQVIERAFKAAFPEVAEGGGHPPKPAKAPGGNAKKP